MYMKRMDVLVEDLVLYYYLNVCARECVPERMHKFRHIMRCIGSHVRVLPGAEIMTLADIDPCMLYARSLWASSMNIIMLY